MAVADDVDCAVLDVATGAGAQPPQVREGDVRGLRGLQRVDGVRHHKIY
jgi:hypothetical protein